MTSSCGARICARLEGWTGRSVGGTSLPLLFTVHSPARYSASAGAELGHAPGEIVAALAGETRHRAIALEMVEMTAGAADRAVCGPGTLSDVFRRARLAKIRPRLLREVFGNRQHVVAFET